MLRRCIGALHAAAAAVCVPRYTEQALGEALLMSAPAAALLSADTSVARVQAAHALIAEALPDVSSSHRLFTFGSAAVLGFHEPASDVDFVALRPEDIADGRGEDSQSQLAKGLQTEFLGRLGRALRQRHVEWQVDEVKRARVPVIKVKTPTVDCDITAHRRNGVRNSALLRAYLAQDPELRWVSVAVKAWSKRSGMNGPAGYLTSYGFNLLAVFYLLRCGLLRFVDPDTACTSTIDPMPRDLPLRPPADPARIGRLLLGFLRYYRYEFDLEHEVVTLSREGRTAKAALNWTRTAEDMKIINAERVAYRLAIEDPYEVNLNVGRNVTPFKLDMMMRTFERGIETGMGLIPTNPK